ncbi:hypothetical protein [Methylobacterium sp. J-068]|uniref:hypothetical protein n=1 Tax=Methylobacterium sp. J-068 TaxID=2836649 RepID=UPI001FB8C9B7|nr:hypothetical protein [Methylobacterium sp. J-068]MCJ2037010.1 hypothetical protein [Methylobacterium sp. J-068]
MKYLSGVLVFAFYMSMLPTQSFACRIMRAPHDKIKLGGFDTLVIGRIKEAQYIGEAKEDYHPWKGIVGIDTVVRGSADQGTIPIHRSGSQAACDDGQPAPPAGQPWALYLDSRNPTSIAIYSFPPPIACEADPAPPEAICKGLPRSYLGE